MKPQCQLQTSRIDIYIYIYISATVPLWQCFFQLGSNSSGNAGSRVRATGAVSNGYVSDLSFWGLYVISRTHTSSRIRIHFGPVFGLKLSLLWKRGDLFEFQTNISRARQDADSMTAPLMDLQVYVPHNPCRVRSQMGPQIRYYRSREMGLGSSP